MVRASLFMILLAPSDELHHLDAVAVAQCRAGKVFAAEDAAIHFDSDAPRGEPQGLEERQHGRLRAHLMLLPVEIDGHRRPLPTPAQAPIRPPCAPVS